MRLEGERLYLKPISVESTETFYKWMCDSEVTKYMGIDKPKSLQDELDWVKNIKDNPNEEVWSIFIKENDKLIGNVGFHELNNPDKNIRIGIVIGEKDEWGKGYGTEVFEIATKYLKEQKGAEKINLTCHKNNTGAQKVYRKSGFEYKKSKKDHPEGMEYMELKF